MNTLLKVRDILGGAGLENNNKEVVVDTNVKPVKVKKSRKSKKTYKNK